MLDRDEIVEQAYFFRTLRERLDWNLPMQDLLANLRQEILSSTKLPLAIDFLLTDLLDQGVFGPAFERLRHYFTAFQSFVVNEAEREQGRFDLQVGLEVLQREAEYRAKSPTPAGVFLYQFETISRNCLRYDQGLAATGQDPIFDAAWRDWLKLVRRQVGIVDIADMIYVQSEEYREQQVRQGLEPDPHKTYLFGVKEGKIAAANRRKEPLLLLLALQRHLGYPAVPRAKPADDRIDMIPQLSRRMERLESRMKLLEQEQKGGIDITKFYGQLPPGAAES